MSLFRMMPKEVVLEVFTHRGWYAGMVPVYVVLDDGQFEEGTRVDACPMLVRNGVPDFMLPLGVFLWSMFTIFYPFMPPLYITGEIDE